LRIRKINRALGSPPPRRSTACASLPEPQGQIRPESPRLPIQPFLNLARTPFLQCLQQVGGLVRANTNPILGHIAEKGTAGSCDRRNEPQDVPKSSYGFLRRR
jgi:hypothetical protein